MSLEAPKVKVAPPTGLLPHGRGFYQLEEEVLYLPIEYQSEKAKFFSYLESGDISLQFGREGRLIFIELTLPRRRWIYLPGLSPLDNIAGGDIRFLDFRQEIANPSVFCDQFRQNIFICFGDIIPTTNYYLAQNLIGQISASEHLISIFVSDIVDDIAGREIAAWRKTLRSAIRQPILSPF
jgi:hypothetical protein